MALLIAIGLAVLATVARAAPLVADPQSCELARFTNCTNTYAQKLGLSEMPVAFAYVIAAINDVIQKQSYPGASMACDAFKGLKHCLGDEISECLSVEFLESIGESSVDAKGFIALAAQQDYTCSLGWIAVTNNWGCIYDVIVNDQTSLLQCTNDYVASITVDPTNECHYNQVLADCVDAVYKSKCENPDVYKWQCMSQMIMFAAASPQCDLIDC